MMKKSLQAILLLVSVFLGIWWGYRQVLPPKAPRDLDETPLASFFAALSIIATLLLYTPLVFLLYAALHVITAYLILPLAMLPLTLVAGKIECVYPD